MNLLWICYDYWKMLIFIYDERYESIMIWWCGIVMTFDMWVKSIIIYVGVCYIRWWIWDWYVSKIYCYICWYLLIMWYWLVSKTQSYMFTDIDCAICWLIWDWQVLNLYEKCDWYICWMIWNWYDDWKCECCTYDDDVLGTIWKYMLHVQDMNRKKRHETKWLNLIVWLYVHDI